MVNSLRPFFPFYGSKWRAVPRYPMPVYDTIIEPFAGSAGYSLRWHRRQVILVERDEYVAATWRYLLAVSPEEILRLPDLEIGQSVDDLDVPQEARWLIGWWCNPGAAAPCKTHSAWTERSQGEGWTTGGGAPFWGEKVRRRIARQLPAIRHWCILEGDYRKAPDIEATWFIDPPYVDKGRHYRHGSERLDFDALGEWCRSRPGQVIVCEQQGADWLPFRPLGEIKATNGTSAEAIWTRPGDPMVQQTIDLSCGDGLGGVE